MATSRPGGFWGTGAGRWIGSTKNIAGAVLAAVAVGAELVFGLGPLWPLVVVASYGVGALVAPRDLIDLRLDVGAAVSAEELGAQLTVLRRSMKAEARRLTDEANSILGRILDALDEIVARWDDLASAPEQRHVVERMIVDYLPTSVQTFVNLPRTYALSSRVEGRKSAHEELLEQLALLESESDRIRTAVYARDAAALSDQSRFLRQKFGRSELDL
ncbi:hypothetical protein ACEXQD_10520 [Herbiconiux sp. P15]|uniref:hypothetical protein n=1 Tax=Herbiconiux liukaitaii TaxID=3342799 RepID=UPI0035B880A3